MWSEDVEDLHEEPSVDPFVYVPVAFAEHISNALKLTYWNTLVVDSDTESSLCGGYDPSDAEWQYAPSGSSSSDTDFYTSYPTEYTPFDSTSYHDTADAGTVTHIPSTSTTKYPRISESTYSEIADWNGQGGGN